MEELLERGWSEEVELCLDNKSTCTCCGNIVDASKGFATAQTGFMCFSCHSEVK